MITFNFVQDWPVLVVIGLFISFIVYLSFTSSRNQSDDKTQNKNK
jgi:hypothetical protein